MFCPFFRQNLTHKLDVFANFIYETEKSKQVSIKDRQVLMKIMKIFNKIEKIIKLIN